MNLVKQLAICLGKQTTPAKSLVAIKGICRFAPLLLCTGIAAVPGVAGAENIDVPATPAKTAAPVQQVFALVNGREITAQEFMEQYRTLIRKRYYHGEPPAAEAESVRKEVAESLIERALLIEEAERRGIKPDESKVAKFAADAEVRYKDVPGWPKQLPELKERVARQSMYEQVEKAIRTMPSPAAADVRAYYEQKPELFTEPEKLRLSIILLSVDPSAPKMDWGQAREKAQEIYKLLKNGAKFADLASQYSSDPSAGDGGDMGYLHGVALGEELQARIDQIQIGGITEPVTVLQGIAIYRVADRIPAKLHEFAEVEPRAKDLLQRDRVDQAWKEITSRLRAAAKVEILLPLGDSTNKQETDRKEAP